MSNTFALAHDAPWLFARVMESSSSSIIVDDIFTIGICVVLRLATKTPHAKGQDLPSGNEHKYFRRRRQIFLPSEEFERNF